MKKSVLTSCIVLVLCAGFALAQQNQGRIQGTVTTADGAVIVGVKVTLTSDSLISRYLETVTNDKGIYRFVLLPIGDYTLKFEKEGYKTIEQSGIGLDFEQTKVIDKSLAPSDFAEVITISGEAPVVDKTSTSVGDKLDIDFLQNTPTNRYIWSIPELTAGFNDDSGLGGNTYGGKRITADGINLTDSATGGDSVASEAFTLEAIEQLDISLFSVNAEYGGFTSGTINVVTKSGGNEFSGEGSYYAQRVDWVSDNTTEFEGLTAPVASDINDVGLALGGPIMQDRIWFFGNYRHYMRDQEREIRFGDVITAERTTDTFMGKVSARWDENNITYFSYSGVRRDDSHRPDWWFYSWWSQLEGSMFTQYTFGDNFLIQHSWVLSDDMILEGRFSTSDSGFDLDPRNPGNSYVDYWTYEMVPVTGTTDGSYSRTEYYDRPRDNAKLTLSYFNDDLAGSHSFKFGLDWERSVAERYYDSQNIFYVDGNRETMVAMETQDPWTAGIRMVSWAGFAQDSWTIGKNLTLNLGLRYDHSGHYSNQPDEAPVGEDAILSFDDFSPRIGFAYDINGDGKWVLKGFLGRYYENLVAGNIESLAIVQPIGYYYLWGPYWKALYPSYYSWMPDDWVLWSTWGGAGSKTVDEDIDNFYTEGITLGIEHELTEQIATGITFVYKRDRNQMGIYAPDATWTTENISISNSNGSYSGPIYEDFNTGSTFIYTNPEKGMVGMPDDLYRNYYALMFEFTKRMSDNWSMQASYTLSRSAGTLDNLWSGVQGFSTYNNPSNFINVNEDTLTSIDRTHAFKGVVTWIAPYDFYITPVFTYLSGTPWAPTYYYRTQTIAIENRDGSRRYDDQFNLDLRLEKAFVIEDRYRVSVLLDIFNVFNDDAVTAYRSTNIASSLYMQPATLVASRYYSVGARIIF